MIIIIEGIDRVGKTTLANMIAKKFNYPIFKDHPVTDAKFSNENVNIEKINVLISLMESGALPNIILDRGHFTEFVYGYIDRHYTNDFLDIFDERLSKLKNLILIYVKPEDIERSSREHGLDLTRHNILMNTCVNNSKIKNIIKTSYSDLNNVLYKLEYEYFLKKLN